jgi:nucleoside 2-deoxyribosyltransferase
MIPKPSPKAYLAGPDVFLPNAVQHAARKVEICERYGLKGVPPLNQDLEPNPYAGMEQWRQIYRKDIAMMESCDLIIANLTPFGGTSADAGTLIEVGWFLGRGKPVFGYSNTAANFQQRMVAHRKLSGDAPDDMAIEGFHLPDNLMIVGAVEDTGCPMVLPKDSMVRGYGALDVFEACVAQAAELMLRDK